MNPILSPDKAAAEKQAVTRQLAAEEISQNDEKLRLSEPGLPVKSSLLLLFTNISVFCKTLLTRVGSFLIQASDRKMYEYFFRRSLVISIICFIFSGPISIWLFENKREEAEESRKEQELLSLSPRTLVVINAVARTTLAQRRVRVPVIKEVDVVVQEIEVPVPELGAVNIGPVSEAGEGSGEGTGSGKLSYRLPEPVMLVPPVYTKEAIKNRFEGSVPVKVLVLEDGTVDKVEIISSSGYTSLDVEAIKAAKKTRFRPGIKNGKKTAMWANYRIGFYLTKRESR